MRCTHLFGPVNSRRLGRSLGVDLVPFKTCPYDCVYCECGETTAKTLQRQEFFPVNEVISELSRFLATSPHLDFITLGGSGEPTLSLSIGTVIRFVKGQFPSYRIAVLTNGCLLSDPAVRHDLLQADVVLPTLSTVNDDTFRKIHHPVPGIDCAGILDGLAWFREDFFGEIWLEVFIIPGLNTEDGELAGLARAIRLIRPDRVQLNTLDRPGTEQWVQPAGTAELARIARVLDYAGTEPVESTCSLTALSPYAEDPVEQVYELLRRRPCTAGDIASSIGMQESEVERILHRMVKTHALLEKREGRGVFYYFRT
jgi:wyosine [tRNA(Phe)-imidazoG37] synthetase (radical SAM superfamily)